VRQPRRGDQADRLFTRQDRIYQVPAFEVICELLHRRGISGATVLAGVDGTFAGRSRTTASPCTRPSAGGCMPPGIGGIITLRGVWGFHGDHAPHGGRHVPAITIVTGTPDRMSAAFSVIDELTAERGLVTSEPVAAIRAVNGDA
jgi:PII-like signaling protein